MVDEALVNIVKSVPEQADSLSSMLQHLDGFDILMNVNANEVAPCICKYNDSKQVC